ncbi:MAG TPA: MerR family transcriptional regulator [Marmoricola sp.]|nr:MerR family transcriptional regulator [Marmoricola sp.]
MRAKDSKAMQIGEVAERSALSLRTLRHYDEIGLLTPSTRSDGGFRLYTEDDFERLMVIRRMKPLGYSLEDMHRVMDLLRSGDDLDAARWAELLAEATERRAELAQKVAMADEFVELLRSRRT